MTVNSAYPRDLADLLPAARSLSERLAKVPSRNLLMRELRIGAPKAQALRTALLREPAGLQLSDPVLAIEVEPDSAILAPEPAAPEPGSVTSETEVIATPSAQVDTVGHPVTVAQSALQRTERKPVRSWILLLLAAPAFVAIWSGWVGLGGLTGFGVVHPLPGIWDSLSLNTAITLPIGVEAYAAYALRVWLSGGVPRRARRFAAVSAVASLILGAAGQVAYHLMTAAGITSAPWQITTLVACLPVAVLGMGAALAHLISEDQ